MCSLAAYYLCETQHLHTPCKNNTCPPLTTQITNIHAMTCAIPRTVSTSSLTLALSAPSILLVVLLITHEHHNHILCSSSHYDNVYLSSTAPRQTNNLDERDDSANSLKQSTPPPNHPYSGSQCVISPRGLYVPRCVMMMAFSMLY